MFDISFSELLVIAIIALVVIGPEKLPKVARTAGAFFGRLQRFVAQVKDEVNRESRFAELQQLQQEVQSTLHQGYADIEQSILPDAETHAEVRPAPSKPARKPRQVKAKPDTTDTPTKKRAAKPAQGEAKAQAGTKPTQSGLFADEVPQQPAKVRTRKASGKVAGKTE